MNWIFAGAALLVFVLCSFWTLGLSGAIVRGLRERHPDVLRQIQPSGALERAIWHIPFNAAWAAAPHIKTLGDTPLQRQSGALRTATIISLAAWATTVAAFWIALTQPQ